MMHRPSVQHIQRRRRNLWNTPVGGPHAKPPDSSLDFFLYDHINDSLRFFKCHDGHIAASHIEGQVKTDRIVVKRNAVNPDNRAKQDNHEKQFSRAKRYQRTAIVANAQPKSRNVEPTDACIRSRACIQEGSVGR